MYLIDNKVAIDGEHLPPATTRPRTPKSRRSMDERLQINIYITLINDTDDIDYKLLMMIITLWYVVLGCHTMCLASAILSTDNHMLVNTGMTHHFIHIKLLINLLEHRITLAPSLEATTKYLTKLQHLLYFSRSTQRSSTSIATFVNNSINNFATYILHDGITSKL
jgi:hypothetical protein